MVRHWTWAGHLIFQLLFCRFISRMGKEKVGFAAWSEKGVGMGKSQGCGVGTRAEGRGRVNPGTKTQREISAAASGMCGCINHNVTNTHTSRPGGSPGGSPVEGRWDDLVSGLGESALLSCKGLLSIILVSSQSEPLCDGMGMPAETTGPAEAPRCARCAVVRTTPRLAEGDVTGGDHTADLMTSDANHEDAVV